MAADITFWAGDESFINDLDGFGLGFYGAAGFGSSVQVGAWQGRTFITNGAGTYEGPEVNNTIRASTSGVIVGQSGGAILLRQLPNYLSTLNIRFTYDTPVKTQNAILRIYDRSNLSSPPTGATVAVAEIVHIDTIQNNNGSGSTAWVNCTPSSSPAITGIASPGISGTRISGANTTGTRHDWYWALSASPDSIGSKTQVGLSFSVEYL